MSERSDSSSPAARADARSAAALTLARADDALRVKGPHGRDLLQYQLQPLDPSVFSLRTAGFFHPIATPSGVVISALAPDDHPHHRGLFLAWVEMRTRTIDAAGKPLDADFWGWGKYATTENRRIESLGVDDVQPDTGHGVGFTARNRWLAGETEMMRETVRVHTRVEGVAQVIDLEYELTPAMDITLPRWAFSGFCLRVRKDGEVADASASGSIDHKTPDPLRPENNWPDDRWYAYTVTLADGTQAGAAVMPHPDNPPATWHNLVPLRMLNPAITTAGDVALHAGTPLRLRYRVVAYDGDLPRAALDQLALRRR